MNFSKILEVTQKMGLVVELELEAVSAVKLLPVFGITDSELPGPVEVRDAFQLSIRLLFNLFYSRVYQGSMLRIFKF